jgi:hypothetical protein
MKECASSSVARSEQRRCGRLTSECLRLQEPRNLLQRSLVESRPWAFNLAKPAVSLKSTYTAHTGIHPYLPASLRYLVVDYEVDALVSE